jgi:predicted DCC family thiol-disulfide oxidoreductase YuxK
MSEDLTKAPPARTGWVLYDDDCGACRSWVPFWRGTLARCGIAIAPLQSPWALEQLAMDEQQAASDLRFLRVDGTHVSGADAYRAVMRLIWWAWPIYVIARLPLLRQVFDWGYRTFARNRHRVSTACGLQGRKGK